MIKKKLSELKIGQIGTVISVEGEKTIRRRLFDMGVTPGCNIKLHKLAPLGDPMEISLRGYELTLRKDEARHVLVEIREIF